MEQRTGTLPVFERAITMPQSPTPGIGVIGAGGIANGAHLREYQKAGFTVAGCADLRREAAEATRQRWGLAYAETDYRRLLERDEIQVVLISTPPDSRVEMVRAAAAAGKHMLLEKPFAHSYADAVAMVRAAEEAGVALAVSQNRRWMPAHRSTRLLLDQDAIGQPFYAVYSGRSNQEYLVGSWYERDNNFLLVEFCVHHLDLLVYWFGEPERVYARTSRAPNQRLKPDLTTAVTLEYADGALVQLTINDVAHDPARGGYWDQDGYLIDGTGGVLEKTENQALALTCDRVDGARVLKTLQPIDTFAASMGDLLDAVQRRREPLCSGRANLATMRTVFAACRSSEEHRPVALADLVEEYER